jgi:hypothetical protein
LQLLLAFLLFYTLYIQFLLLNIGKKINRDREKILSKIDIKINNIFKTVEIYEIEDSDLSMQRVVILFYYFPASIFNYINARKDVQYLSDLIIKYQKLTSIEKAALKDHIYDCFQLKFSFTPKLFREYVNKLYKMKGDDKEIKKNWYLEFYKFS